MIIINKLARKSKTKLTKFIKKPLNNLFLIFSLPFTFSNNKNKNTLEETTRIKGKNITNVTIKSHNEINIKNPF